MDMEQEIAQKANKAPRVTPADIEAEIASEHYFTAREGCEGASGGGGTYPAALGLLTFCVLVLRNGFTVTGESACASPENFDAEIGRKVARANAVSKIWPLLGFRLRDQLAGASEAIKSERRAIAFGDIVQSQVIAMRAAVVAAKLEGLEVGMQWIANTLEGPGHLPDLDEAKALGGAQALWDKETAEHEAFRAAHPAP